MDASPVVSHSWSRAMLPSAIKDATKSATRVSRRSIDRLQLNSSIKYSNPPMILNLAQTARTLMLVTRCRSLLVSVLMTLVGCASIRHLAGPVHPSRIAANSSNRARAKSHNSLVTPPPYAARTASLDVTFGLQVAGIAPLPDGFEPDMSRPPVWLDRGEIGIFGMFQGRKVVWGIGGTGLSSQRIIVDESGVGGRLLDVALNVDGQVASAVSIDANRSLNVDVANAYATSGVRRVTTLPGNFDWAELKWLSRTELALVTHAAPLPNDELNSSVPQAPATGLYLISVSSHPSTRRLERITCPLSSLFFSPDGSLAVAQGAADAPAALVDLRKQRCLTLRAATPVQLLGWAPGSTAFLYRLADPPGVYRFDLESAEPATIAVSSGAAAYATDGAIIALGSQQLSWRRVVSEPLAPVNVQIAIFEPRENIKTINSLGFATLPTLLFRSTMVLSPATNN